MKFTFTSSGKLVSGVPFVAKIFLSDESYELQRKYVENTPSITHNGDVTVSVEYEAENYEIIEERYGSCNHYALGSYNMVYRNKLIMLGSSNDEVLQEKIMNFLEGKLSPSILLYNIDEDIKEQYKEELQEIFERDNFDKVDIRKNKLLDISEALKEFIKDNKYIRIIFNDYHIIFNSNEEKIIINFSNDENIYIETNMFKLNIKIEAIDDYKIYNKKNKFNKIELNMTDGATIILISD